MEESWGEGDVEYQEETEEGGRGEGLDWMRQEQERVEEQMRTEEEERRRYENERKRLEDQGKRGEEQRNREE